MSVFETLVSLVNNSNRLSPFSKKVGIQNDTVGIQMHSFMLSKATYVHVTLI